MGYPTKTLTEIIDNINFIEGDLKPTFYSFILYKSKHELFRRFILDNFNRLHNRSGKAVFFVIDKPEEWLNRNDIDYYRNRVGNYYVPELRDEEVNKAAYYFNVFDYELPAVVLFTSLNQQNWTIISLSDLEPNRLKSFFYEMFETQERNNDKYRNTYINLSLINRLQHRFPQIKYKSVNNSVLDSSIYDELQKLRAELQQLREENREGFRIISEKLEIIHKDFLDYKRVLQINIKNITGLNESNLADKEYEKLLSEYDDKLLDTSKNIINEATNNVAISFVGYDFLENFEEESTTMIRSGLKVYELINNKRIESFDYSLCAAGLWKAVEVELNIILLDAIRIIKKYIQAIPSYGRPSRQGRLNVFAGQKRNTDYYVNINQQQNNQFSKIMFGDMIRISDNWEKNEYQEIMNEIKREQDTSLEIRDFMNDFVTQFKSIVYDYRNESSHTRIMSEQQYLQMKDILMRTDGLYRKISRLKGNIYSLYQ